MTTKSESSRLMLIRYLEIFCWLREPRDIEGCYNLKKLSLEMMKRFVVIRGTVSISSPSRFKICIKKYFFNPKPEKWKVIGDAGYNLTDEWVSFHVFTALFQK